MLVFGTGVEVCSTDISTVENPYYPDQDLVYNMEQVYGWWFPEWKQHFQQL